MKNEKRSPLPCYQMAAVISGADFFDILATKSWVLSRSLVQTF
jgi:hypothetical protein